jgi:hypothetical protein
VLSSGNYDNRLLYGEDRDLGEKLLKAGYEVIFDPEIKMTAITKNDLWQVLERYCRWHATKNGQMSWYDYAKLIAYSMKVMAFEDLKTHDWQSALISLICPHYQFWSPYNRPSQSS